MTKDNDNNQDREKEVELVVLKFINTEYELNLTKAVLEDNEIPYVIKDQGMGGYMRILGGLSSMYKTEVLVEESTYPKAKAILDEVFSETVED